MDSAAGSLVAVLAVGHTRSIREIGEASWWASMSRGQTSAAFGEFAIERAPPSWCKPGYRTELLCGMIKLDECIVDIAPAPTLRRIVTFDDRVSARLKMLGGVLAGRLVATTDVAT
jgi:hypothetical protein